MLGLLCNHKQQKMKSKILNALKTEYATMGLGEKAFDGVAAFLVKTVTEESKIDEAIKADEVKMLLKGFQGDTDSLRGKAAQLQKDYDAYKAAHPDKKTDDKDEPAGNEAYEARLAELEKKWQEAEKKAASATILTNVRTRLEKDCKDAPILKQVLKGFSLSENETEDEAVARLTAEYNTTVKEIRGEGYIPPVSSGYQAPAYKGGDFKSEVERLKAEGKIPTANS